MFLRVLYKSEKMFFKCFFYLQINVFNIYRFLWPIVGHREMSVAETAVWHTYKVSLNSLVALFTMI